METQTIITWPEDIEVKTTTKIINKPTANNQTKTIITKQKRAIEDKTKTKLINSNHPPEGFGRPR